MDRENASMRMNTRKTQIKRLLGWASFNPGAMSFTPGLATIHQGPLFDLSSVSLPALTNMATGAHTFYLVVDLEMNGVFDIDQLFYDAVTVNIE